MAKGSSEAAQVNEERLCNQENFKLQHGHELDHYCGRRSKVWRFCCLLRSAEYLVSSLVLLKPELSIPPILALFGHCKSHHQLQDPFRERLE